MIEFAKRSLNRDDTSVQEVLRYAFGLEAQESGGAVMAWPEGRPPAHRLPVGIVRLLTALHTADCASRAQDYRGRALRCDCGALDRDTVDGKQPLQRDPNRLTRADRIAEGAMLRSRALKSLRNPHDWALRAYYTPPTTDLSPKKGDACLMLGRYLHYDAGHDATLMADAAWHWAGGGESRMTRSYVEWAKELDVDRRTVYGWVKGRRGWSAWNVLDALLAETHSTLAIVFSESA